MYVVLVQMTYHKQSYFISFKIICEILLLCVSADYILESTIVKLCYKIKNHST